ncbi:unnamed protein product [Ranitomeya imitator]|uniref:Transferrin-like domain-containing protein n=1 Tax=Ranitomeya imitator TaxID=111125 RepID=A0ABN9L0V3_9NEOB|nr:unnamed protein product [Ranitomeya imitator]
MKPTDHSMKVCIPKRHYCPSEPRSVPKQCPPPPNMGYQHTQDKLDNNLWAVTKTRNIRWCLTSESEYKKCRDLARLCKSADIPLICVKRTSLEDCFLAIKDGDADALTVDSGNVYKASLHPYNLKPILAESYGPQKETCYYAVAVVKKSSTFKFNELRNKRSCHSGIGQMDGWYSLLRALHEKRLLNWTIEETERAVSKYFSASCVPGATQPNLCKQCIGQGSKKCKLSNDEPYYGPDGAFRCLRDNKGDVAFVPHTTLPDGFTAWDMTVRRAAQLSKNFQLLCPDNSRKSIDQYQQCNMARIPVNTVVTRSTGDKAVDIVTFFQNAQKKECKLSGTKSGKNLLLRNPAAIPIPLPSSMDAFLYLGASHFGSIRGMSVLNPPSKEMVRWCTQSKQEKMKCDDWTPASGGAIECTQAYSAEECILQVLKGEADAVTLDGGYLYTAGQCGLVPAMGEYYNQGTYYAVAVVKKSNKDISWNNLKGKMSCHTAVGRTAGWNIPVGLINKKNNNCDIGECKTM